MFVILLTTNKQINKQTSKNQKYTFRIKNTLKRNIYLIISESSSDYSGGRG